MLGVLGLKIRQVPTIEAIKIILASVSSPDSRMVNRVLGILTLIGIQHLEEANTNSRGAMEVRCNVQKRPMLNVAELTVESADRALMPASVVVRVDTWSETVHRTEVRLEVMLSLGLSHRVQQQPSLLRGTNSMS